jgi:hypothetical protein
MKEQKTQTYKEKETKKPEIKKDGAAFKENIYKLQKAINIPLSNPIVAYLEKFDEYFKKNKRKLTS